MHKDQNEMKVLQLSAKWRSYHMWTYLEDLYWVWLMGCIAFPEEAEIICWRSDQQGVVLGECSSCNCSTMLHITKTFTGFNIPEPCSVVIWKCDSLLAIWRETGSCHSILVTCAIWDKVLRGKREGQHIGTGCKGRLLTALCTLHPRCKHSMSSRALRCWPGRWGCSVSSIAKLRNLSELNSEENILSEKG